MIILVVSDFHLGKGKFLKNGQVNILEDFFEDDRFMEFTQYYSSGKNYWNSIHLVLNGDILNLIQIDIEGTFSHIVDAESTITALETIWRGHKGFFDQSIEVWSTQVVAKNEVQKSHIWGYFGHILK